MAGTSSVYPRPPFNNASQHGRAYGVNVRMFGCLCLFPLVELATIAILLLQDCYDAPLTFSGGEFDTMLLALLRCVYTGRNDTHMVLSAEQAIPTFRGWLNFNRYVHSCQHWKYSKHCIDLISPTDMIVTTLLSQFLQSCKRLLSRSKQDHG